MKKLIAIFCIVNIFTLVACTDQTENEPKEKQPTVEDSKMKVKSATVEFHAALIEAINKHDTSINTYLELKEKADDETAHEKPTYAEIETWQKHASENAQKVAEAVKAVKIPEAFKGFMFENAENVRGSLQYAYSNLPRELEESNKTDNFYKFFDMAQETLNEMYSELHMEKVDLRKDVE